MNHHCRQLNSQHSYSRLMIFQAKQAQPSSLCLSYPRNHYFFCENGKLDLYSLAAMFSIMKLSISISKSLDLAMSHQFSKPVLDYPWILH